jgi:hypothetical protein
VPSASVRGDIGDVDVEITVNGEDDKLVNLVFSDLKGRADELSQMVDEGIPVGETYPPISVWWADTDYTVDDE